MKIINFWLFAFCSVGLLQIATAQNKAAKPTLVVGIVVDQMRYDYITRYWDLYGNGGFKKLVGKGFNFTNAHYEFVPTYTGAGHANISTGAFPSINGIVGNEWYERLEKRLVYCAEDSTVFTVGSTSKAGQMSPRRLLSTTVGDELRISSNFKSRVYGVALKDRGAILSTGRSATGAYWFDDASGNFITSSYYSKDLPKWLNDFNASKLPKKYLSQVWSALNPDGIKTVSIEDVNPYEGKYKGVDKPGFPYDLSKISKSYTGFELIRSVPFGNTLTFDFARELIKQEKLGQTGTTDLFMISLSTPDYMGHQYGPRSMEIADMYLRLDSDIENFLKFLESTYPDQNYLIFLTADHGVVDNPQFLSNNKLPGGNFNNSVVAELRSELSREYGEDLILYVENLQIYLNYDKLSAKKLKREDVIQFCVNFLEQFDPIQRVLPSDVLKYSLSSDPFLIRYSNGYHPGRSGDLAIILDPGFIEMRWQVTGTTHGSPYSYDTHVPILWYGKGIQSGESSTRVSVSDIAPTLSSFLQISFPSGTVGRILGFENR